MTGQCGRSLNDLAKTHRLSPTCTHFDFATAYFVSLWSESEAGCHPMFARATRQLLTFTERGDSNYRIKFICLTPSYLLAFQGHLCRVEWALSFFSEDI
ncbi:hypothetical protein CDAR_613151 [Caerostris darwini]|uniref:Uncharacterized protein n=1 Tax=Caerostris darwini TaxID=1538125 RepID=A0AAV4UL44_9ARAC|nr:hypothetical protein CDAR_613151 [Caerostris darwini]